MNDLILENTYEDMILNESPVDDISQIRSKHFTQDTPPRAKFKKGDPIAITASAIQTTRALRNFKPGDKGQIVGMAQYTGQGAASEYSKAHGANRYYVKMGDGKIYPVKSQYIVKSNEADAPHVQSSDVPKTVVRKDGTQKSSVLSSMGTPPTAVPTQPASSSSTLDTILDSVDLGDFLHYMKEYYKTLQPDQQKQMTQFLMDRISPKVSTSGGPRAVSPFGDKYRNVPGYRPGNKWQDEQYRAVQSR